MQHSPICPAAAVCAAAATGPATSSSPRTAQSSSPPSARTPTSTTPTPIPKNFTAPTCSSSRPKASSSRSTPGACATASARPSIPSPASSGAPPTSATPRQQPRARLRHPCAGRRLLRLALVLHGRASGSAPPGQASRAQVEGHHARHSRQSPLRLARDVLLRGLAVPRRVQRRRLRRRARLVEPRPAHRLRSHPPAHAQRPRHRRVRRLPHRLRRPATAPSGAAP
jgi:hypothetical protein